MRLLRDWKVGCVLCILYAASAAVLSAQVTVTSNVTIGGPSPWTDVTSPTVGVTTGSQTAAALNTALGNCNGGTLFFPPSASAYVFTTQITVTTRCTLVTDSLYPAHIQRGFSQSSTNAYVGLMQVTASGVSIQGLEIDGNNGTYTGNCITVAAQVTDIQIDNNYIHNCDGDSIDLVGTSQGNPGPSRVQITRNRIISGANGEGAIHARDTGDDILIAENPIIDGSQMTTGNSSATIQLQSSGLTTALTNISIENNPKILCAADFCLQAGGFNGYTMTGLKVTGNGMELAQNSTGFISTLTLGGVFSNNTFNTHFVDLYQTGSDGVTNGTTTFTSASANFTSSVTGRTLVCMGCGVSSGNLITTVTYVNATTVTLGTAATSSASGQTWQLFGYSHTLVAVELPETTGAVVTDNTCYCEGSFGPRE